MEALRQSPVEELAEDTLGMCLLEKDKNHTEFLSSGRRLDEMRWKIVDS